MPELIFAPLIIVDLVWYCTNECGSSVEFKMLITCGVLSIIDETLCLTTTRPYPKFVKAHEIPGVDLSNRHADPSVLPYS